MIEINHRPAPEWLFDYEDTQVQCDSCEKEFSYRQLGEDMVGDNPLDEQCPHCGNYFCCELKYETVDECLKRMDIDPKSLEPKDKATEAPVVQEQQGRHMLVVGSAKLQKAILDSGLEVHENNCCLVVDLDCPTAKAAKEFMDTYGHRSVLEFEGIMFLDEKQALEKLRKFNEAYPGIAEAMKDTDKDPTDG